MTPIASPSDSVTPFVHGTLWRTGTVIIISFTGTRGTTISRRTITTIVGFTSFTFIWILRFESSEWTFFNTFIEVIQISWEITSDTLVGVWSGTSFTGIVTWLTTHGFSVGVFTIWTWEDTRVSF
jgi:hypothetical protein